MSDNAKRWINIVAPIASMAAFLISCICMPKAAWVFVVGYLAGIVQFSWHLVFGAAPANEENAG